MVPLQGRALIETELGPSLVVECALGQSPAILEVVIAWPRVIHRFEGLGVQNGVYMDFLHLLPRDPKTVRLVWLVKEAFASAISGDRGRVMSL